jgi:uncharacterized protein YdhG (YjbR/CyaY superfamily)
MKSRTPATVDEYFASVEDADKRATLQQLRRTIKAALPRAEECISYGMPAVRYDGRVVAWYAAAKNHCAYYPGGIPAEFRDAVKKYDTSKGTIRFQPDKPLPATLVKRLLKARIAANAARVTRSPTAASSSKAPAG